MGGYFVRTKLIFLAEFQNQTDKDIIYRNFSVGIGLENLKWCITKVEIVFEKRKFRENRNGFVHKKSGEEDEKCWNADESEIDPERY